MAFSDLAGAVLREQRDESGAVVGCIEVGKSVLVLCQDCVWETCPMREVA
jgi:hypothetical protein